MVNAASVHTHAFAITHIILDLVGSGKPQYIEELKEEICSVLAEHGGQWEERALAQMHKLDSVLGESQRLNSVLTIGPLRIVNAKNGVTTPSGVFIPKGYQIGIPAFESHIDTNIFGPDAPEFRPFRFTDKRLDSDDDHVQRARHAWVTASPEYLSFGGVTDACPGRFFAPSELKIILGHILSSYDFVMHHERSRNIRFNVCNQPTPAY